MGWDSAPPSAEELGSIKKRWDEEPPKDEEIGSPSAGLSGLEHYGSAVSLGALPYLQAATEKALSPVVNYFSGTSAEDEKLKAQGFSLPEEKSFSQIVDESNKRRELEAKNHPTASMIGTGLGIANSIAAMPVMGVAGNTALGAAQGAMQDTGHKFLSEEDIKKRLINTGMGAGLGYGLSEAVSPGLSYVSNAAQNAAQRATRASTEAAVGALQPTPQMRKFLRNTDKGQKVGEMLKNEGVLGEGLSFNNPEKMETIIDSIIEDSGNKIGNIANKVTSAKDPMRGAQEFEQRFTEHGAQQGLPLNTVVSRAEGELIPTNYTHEIPAIEQELPLNGVRSETPTKLETFQEGLTLKTPEQTDVHGIVSSQPVSKEVVQPGLNLAVKPPKQFTMSREELAASLKSSMNKENLIPREATVQESIDKMIEKLAASGEDEISLAQIRDLKKQAGVYAREAKKRAAIPGAAPSTAQDIFNIQLEKTLVQKESEIFKKAAENGTITPEEYKEFLIQKDRYATANLASDILAHRLGREYTQGMHNPLWGDLALGVGGMAAGMASGEENKVGKAALGFAGGLAARRAFKYGPQIMSKAQSSYSDALMKIPRFAELAAKNPQAINILASKLATKKDEKKGAVNGEQYQDQQQAQQQFLNGR